MSRCIPSPGQSLEEAVIPVLRPTGRQLSLLASFYVTIKNRLEPCLREQGLDAIVTIQGSFAKGTLLSDKWEIDIFIIIKGIDKKFIVERGEWILSSCASGRLPFIVKYSQHPYITISLMGLEADVVPVGEPRPGRFEGLGVERTPLHTEYVRTRINDRLRDEVRLLKSWLKGVGIYGAETHKRGFSGYLAELLVLTFGGFRETLSAASRWKPPVYIDPEGVGDRSLLERKYKDSPLIVVDPTDPARNAAAAVSLESLERMILASKLYLARPHPWFFHACQPQSLGLPPLPGYALRVECVGRLDRYPPDSVWGRLSRAARNLRGHLERAGFKVVYLTFNTDEASRLEIEVLLEACTLPLLESTSGPSPYDNVERIIRFVHKRLSEKGGAWPGVGRLVGGRPRRARSAIRVTSDWLQGDGARPVTSMGVRCSVSCEECKRGDTICNPTPAWLAYLSTAPSQ